MTNSTKDQLAADFEKAKNAGSVRVERIRQIFQDAMTQTVAELKQGTGEIRSIAKESTSTLTETLRNAQKTEPQNQVVPVQVEIQDDSAETTISGVEIVEATAEPTPVDTLVLETPATEAAQEVTQSQALTQTVADNSRESAEPATTESLMASLKALIEQVITSFKAGEAHTVLQQQLAKLKEHMATLDTKLGERYGDRYEGVKREFNQDMEKTKAWYEEVKAHADENGMNVLEYKQAELVIKMGEVGMTIAQKEEKIKQLLKELWQTATKL